MSYYDICDPPEIERTERTGYPGRKKPAWPRCPVCDEECEVVYRGWYGKVVGCNVCMDALDPWEIDECFPGRR